MLSHSYKWISNLKYSALSQSGWRWVKIKDQWPWSLYVVRLQRENKTNYRIRDKKFYKFWLETIVGEKYRFICVHVFFLLYTYIFLTLMISGRWSTLVTPLRSMDSTQQNNVLTCRRLISCPDKFFMQFSIFIFDLLIWGGIMVK